MKPVATPPKPSRQRAWEMNGLADGGNNDSGTDQSPSNKTKGGFLSKSIRALQQTASSPSRKPAHHHLQHHHHSATGAHKRQPTEDSLAVQISPDEEVEIASNARVLTPPGSGEPLFAPRHRRTITPMGGGELVGGSDDHLSSSMKPLPSNAAMTPSSSGSPDRSKILSLHVAGSSGGGKKKSKKNQKTKLFSMDETKPLPRLGNDPSKHSVRNISTEVLADEVSVSQNANADPKAERNAYYASLTLSRNDYGATSFFGGVLARDDNAGEFRSTVSGASDQASIFRAGGTNSERGRRRSQGSSRAIGEHFSEFDIGTTLPFQNDDTIHQTGSFDTLLSRDRSFHLGPLRSKHRSGGGGESRAAASAIRVSNRSLLLDGEDNHSISNLTHRSGMTTGSIETVQHANKNKAKREKGANAASRTIASRVKTIDEDGDESADNSDQDNNEKPGGSSSKKSLAAKVLRQTGTIIKRALRDVTGNNSKGGTNKAKMGLKKGISERIRVLGKDGVEPKSRGKLGSEPGIQWNLGNRVGSSSGVFAPSRSRIQSADVYCRHQLNHEAQQIMHEIEDAAIFAGGRRDGLDIIDLGPARYQTIANERLNGKEMDNGPLYTPQRMVGDLLRAGGGKNQPEIIFEGPSGEAPGRWVVPVGSDIIIHDQPSTKDDNSSDLATTVSACEPDVSSSADLYDFLPCFGASEATFPAEESHPSLATAPMWGKDSQPPPEVLSQMKRLERNKSAPNGTDEDVLFGTSSCPMDVDEDVFIIESPQHLDAVHEVVALAIRREAFGQALRVLAKLIRSLNHRAREQDDVMIQLLLASTHQNMATICLWMNRLSEARHNINKAIEKRTAHFPQTHSAIAISLARRGLVEFGLNDFDASLNSFRCAVKILNQNTSKHYVMIAKLENNIGCGLFQQSKFQEALKHFTTSLDMQRPSVEGHIRREVAVFDCGVTLTNLGKTYLMIKDYEMAPYVYEEALLLQTSIFAKNHSSVLRTLGSLAFVKSVIGEGKAALRLYRATTRVLVASHGEASQENMDIMALTGALYVEQQSYGEALKCFKGVLAWQKRQLPCDHPTLEKTALTVQRIEAMLEICTT